MARVADIITIASRMSGISEHAIKGDRRWRHYSAIRCAIYQVARDNQHSYPQMARALNRRDHSSALSVLRHRKLYETLFPQLPAFCEALSLYAAQLPAFVADTDWTPPVSFALRRPARRRMARLTEWGLAA